MPRASPETMVKPASPTARASRSVKVIPAADALRDPTIASMGRASALASPRTTISGGAESIARRAFGYSGSPVATKRPPSRCVASISRSTSSRLAIFRPGRPLRRAIWGSASSAAPAPPWRLTSVWKVRGPMLSDRISHSQAILCSSVRRALMFACRCGSRFRRGDAGCSRDASTRARPRAAGTARPSAARRATTTPPG
jgi:hypothetical protein